MVKQTQKAPMGRPPLPPEKRKRASMGFRPTLDMRKKLEDAAATSGRSMTQEVELRLERSFETEKRADEIAGIAREFCYDNFGGKHRYIFFRMAASCVADAEELTGEYWLDDLRTFKIATSAINASFENIGPEAPDKSPGSTLRDFVGGERSPSELGIGIARHRLDEAIRTYKSKKSTKKPE